MLLAPPSSVAFYSCSPAAIHGRMSFLAFHERRMASGLPGIYMHPCAEPLSGLIASPTVSGTVSGRLLQEPSLVKWPCQVPLLIRVAGAAAAGAWADMKACVAVFPQAGSKHVRK